MEILINNHDMLAFTSEMMALVKRVVERVLQLEKVENALEVSILITNNQEIKALNAEYRQQDVATDVLSFTMDAEYLGDIVISMDKVLEQAEKYGHSVERELAFLTVHGLLHLLGYDHQVASDQLCMRQREEEILNQLEITRNFSSPHPEI